MTRIYKDKCRIDKDKILSFFEDRAHRAKNKEIANINAVLYQDSNIQLAKNRDDFEKKLLLPLLPLSSFSNVLDVGCGIGRWAEVLLNNIACYHGVDFSPSLIDIAKNRFSDRSNVNFHVAACEDLSMELFDINRKFDIVISVGLLIYLNSFEIKKYFEALTTCLDRKACIYIREPIAIEEHLTLADFYSQELKHDYHAIYRKEEELNELFTIFTSQGFILRMEQWLYPNDTSLNNRQETRQKFWLFERDMKS